MLGSKIIIIFTIDFERSLWLPILIIETLEILTSYARQAQFNGLNQLSK